MSGFKIDIKNKVDFGELTDDIKQVINDELQIFGVNTVAMAKTLSNPNVDTGTLKNSISFDKGDLYVDIIAGVFYAAYIEFGTGVFAAAYVPSLPSEIQAFALTFFVNGKGRIPASPFLFPAILKNSQLLIENLKKQL